MRTCTRHFEQLSAALKHRGLWHLVNTTPLIMKGRAHRWLNGTATREDFDPLMVAVFEINKKATDALGEYIMNKRADGNAYCPLCEMAYKLKDPRIPDAWIENVADLMDLTAVKNDLRRATV